MPWRSDGLADQSLAESQRLIRCWLGLLLRAVSTELRLRNSGTALTQTGHGQNSCLHCSQALVRLLLWGARAGHAQGHCARCLGSSSTSHSCLRGAPMEHHFCHTGGLPTPSYSHQDGLHGWSLLSSAALGLSTSGHDFRATFHKTSWITTSTSMSLCSAMLSSSRESTRKPSIMASCAPSSTAWLCLSMSSKHCAQLGTQPWGLDFDVAAHSPKTVFQFAYCFCDHAENIWLLLDFARKGRALPAAPSDLASQPPPPKQAFDFEQLMGLTRGSQHGPGNEDLDALTDRLPLHSLTPTVLLDIIRIILTATPGPWIYWNQSEAAKRELGKTCKDQAHFAVLLALARRSRRGTLVPLGEICWRRPGYLVLSGKACHARLNILAITAASIRSLDTYAESAAASVARPARAPPESCWRDAAPPQLQQQIWAALGLVLPRAADTLLAPSAPAPTRLDDGFGSAEVPADTAASSPAPYII